jgi:hypothetical protein
LVAEAALRRVPLEADWVVDTLSGDDSESERHTTTATTSHDRKSHATKEGKDTKEHKDKDHAHDHHDEMYTKLRQRAHPAAKPFATQFIQTPSFTTAKVVHSYQSFCWIIYYKMSNENRYITIMLIVFDGLVIMYSPNQLINVSSCGCHELKVIKYPL